ncbi:phosphoenolpyruvate carboxylase [Teredinibacter waterburyi]|jgi:Phosphoenolpyruvate carboxylase (EC 4.1.1.31)|uniref:phosphoenolpyruvate carboxylase n=1 Tax=Teredinibacter waterburyi TaxID=1500538 RepID=UPI00165F9665|nr:phosphoenolpyruvate carboxylase [Teredinibacter waterburyi]
MQKLPETLRDNVRLLGELLGENILEHEGHKLFRKIEEIRALSKSLAQQSVVGNASIDYKPLVEALSRLEDKDILPIARAFNQFLNLANIADQQYFYGPEARKTDTLEPVLNELTADLGKDDMFQLMNKLRIDLVLTAHPTEVSRRTLIRKYERLADVLSELKRSDLFEHEVAQLNAELYRVIEEIWHTDEIRAERPTAVDEAKWGFAVIENSLWHAVPDFIRHLDTACCRQLGKALPLEIQPFQFFSWMGGDRDGNPNVTHEVTEEVILLGRWKAADLYLQDLQILAGDLSMHSASSELIDAVGFTSRTPYREFLHGLRGRLQATLDWADARILNPKLPEPAEIIHTIEDLLQPLLLCHRSLTEVGLPHIANGALTDIIRRVRAFGINLVPLDIRQDGDRHVQVLDELTNYLDLGSYREWDEDARQAFLLEQLTSKRPLLPAKWPLTKDSAEVIDTCRVIAAQPEETLSHYVISMAKQPSDVLAVALLLKECGVTWNMPIVPLFETLDDLDRAPRVMNQLWQNHWYQGYIDGEQTVMIGYSDSAKDAGKFAATWAQYKSQEKLVSLSEQHGVELFLFHGRGGTVGRGGGPVEKAMASQPPGSVKGRIRVTEQGEMIRYKFGLPRVAFSSLSNYVAATLRATVTPAPAPSEPWRALIEDMAQASLKAYRDIVRGNEMFVPYFRSLTPEQELNKLALGSRPAKRKATGGVESLRAIPWVFAWMQVRLNLPGWLGTRQALAYGLEHDPKTLEDMFNNWPFFSSFIDLLEMVLGKADTAICAHYEQQLVDPQLHSLGKQLREDLEALAVQINTMKNQNDLLDTTPMLQQSIDVRKPYIDPLNYLQAELLKRERKSGEIGPELEQALKVTMTGIAAGMRNTG